MSNYIYINFLTGEFEPDKLKSNKYFSVRKTEDAGKANYTILFEGDSSSFIDLHGYDGRLTLSFSDSYLYSEEDMKKVYKVIEYIHYSLKAGAVGVDEVDLEELRPSKSYSDISRFWEFTLLTPEEVEKYGGLEKVKGAPCEIIKVLDDGAVILKLSPLFFHSPYEHRCLLRKYFGENTAQCVYQIENMAPKGDEDILRMKIRDLIAKREKKIENYADYVFYNYNYPDSEELGNIILIFDIVYKLKSKNILVGEKVLKSEYEESQFEKLMSLDKLQIFSKPVEKIVVVVPDKRVSEFKKKYANKKVEVMGITEYGK